MIRESINKHLPSHDGSPRTAVIVSCYKWLDYYIGPTSSAPV
jgi:hypothetical protein